MAIEVETHRSAKERMNDWETEQNQVWESEQNQVWERLETLAFVYSEFASLGIIDQPGDQDQDRDRDR